MVHHSTETVWAFKNPESQMKSADLVTYDDNGNVIPLSERFNLQNDDIRYSLSEDSEGTQLSKEQQEYFKDSKVRDKIGNEKALKQDVKADSKTINYSLNVEIQKEIDSFNVQKKMNDYIGVQKSVIPTLNKESFFRDVINKETGMVININPKGIKETLGSGKRFQKLPRRLKELKIATIRSLPELIENARLNEDNAVNLHGDSANYAYFKITTDINGVPFDVRIDVKKTSAMNRFWIHNIDITEKDSQLLSPDKNQAINEIENPLSDIVTENQEKSTPNFSLSKDSDGNALSDIPSGNYNIYGEDIQLGPVREDIAPKQDIQIAPAIEDDLPIRSDLQNRSDFEGIPIRSDIPNRSNSDDIAPIRYDLSNNETKQGEIPLPIRPEYSEDNNGQLSMFEQPEQPTSTKSGRIKNELGTQRKWVGTSTESDAVGSKVLPDDLDQSAIYYQPISNKKTLGNANAQLERMGYEHSVHYFNSQFENKKIALDDIALGERLIQEAVKKGDYETAGQLIQNVSILGTELGQKVQALSIIKRLTPEGQLQMLQKMVKRGQVKGDKAYEGVEITQDMIDHILSVYGKDGGYDQNELNRAVEEVKQQIADQMKVTFKDKVNAWRMLSMLGNPKTHIRNLVSNVSMFGTRTVKNVVARTIEDVALPKQTLSTTKDAAQQKTLIPNGTRVKALDRNNYGIVKSYDETTGKYSVYFESKQGHSATVQLDATKIKSLTPIKNIENDNNSLVRTKTWQRATDEVKEFVNNAILEMQKDIRGEGKYSNDTELKRKRAIFS